MCCLQDSKEWLEVLAATAPDAAPGVFVFLCGYCSCYHEFCQFYLFLVFDYLSYLVENCSNSDMYFLLIMQAIMEGSVYRALNKKMKKVYK